MEGEEIKLDQIVAPETNKTTVVEGAGGLMVPLNQQETILDLMKQINLPIVLVSKNYLGSINHTLLSVKTIQNAGLNLKGIIMVGDENVSSERAIQNIGNTKILCHIKWSHKIDANFIDQEATRLANLKNQLI